MTTTFSFHQRPNVSRLEPFRAEIEAMRKSNWPLRRIAQWLRDTHAVAVSHEAVRKFCLVRRIAKYGGKAQPGKNLKSSEPHSGPNGPIQPGTPKNLFSYDDSKPVQTRRGK